MKGKFYLDYSNNIRVEFIIMGNSIRYKIFCNSDSPRLSHSIVRNLNQISEMIYYPEIDSFVFRIKDDTFVTINKTTLEVTYKNKLTSFETRKLSQGKTEEVPLKREDEALTTITDLHTHFAGAMTNETLITLGLKHNINYPIRFLKLIGIDTSKYNSDSFVRLRDLTKEDLEILKKALKLPIITQETFKKMEDIYLIRGPFTKSIELFPELLMSLAMDYKNMGIRYAELSFSTFTINKEFTKALEKYLPIIERETGVKIRFLIGMWRHSDKEWNLDEIDKIKIIAKCPYIVGCDFMGRETNQTLDFEEELRILTRYAILEDPYFVIRIHAGENPMYKTNVYDALKIIYDEHKKIEKTFNKKLKMPQIRIGHGLYGLDITRDGKGNDLEKNAVINLAREMGAIIEFNMSSNLALNNIDSLTVVPIKRFIDSGVGVVLGTDGHGLYSTTSSQEAVLADSAGLDTKDFEKILETEKEIIRRAELREKTHPHIVDVDKLYESIKYGTKDGRPRYSEELERRNKQRLASQLKRLSEQLEEIGAITDDRVIAQDTFNKTPILITGASKNNWPNISKTDQYYIRLTMQVLANVLNPDTAYIVTGGTNFGVERTMHEAVNNRNKVSNNPIVLLGTLTLEATKSGFNEVEKDTITHATILEIDGQKARNWLDLPDTQLKLVQENNGQMIAIGGGSVVNDMIQRAHNLGITMHLMDGPYGASTTKSRSMSGNEYSFKTIEELLVKIYNKNPALLIPGFNLDNIHYYIREAQKMIQNNHNEELNLSI